LPQAPSYGRLAFVCLACSGLLFAVGCGGTNTTGSVPALATPVPGSTSGQVSPAGPSSSTVSTTSGGSGTVGFPASTTGSSSVQVAFSATPPSGVPSLKPASFARRVQSTDTAGIVYVSLTFGATVTLPSLPAFTFGNQTITPSTQYYLAFYNSASSAYQPAAEGPATIAGSTIAFSAPATPYTFAAGTTYVFALYGQTLAPIVASNTSLSFTALGAGAAQTFNLTEAGYSGAFSATSANPAVATVAPSTPAGTFTVTPVGGGTTTITITDTNLQTITVGVSVTTGTFIPQ
jgi:hypothetical protein